MVNALDLVCNLKEKSLSQSMCTGVMFHHLYNTPLPAAVPSDVEHFVSGLRELSFGL